MVDEPARLGTPVICGIEELSAHRARGFRQVVSILDPGADVPDAFQAFDRHDRLELRFHDIIDDGSAFGYMMPERHHIESLLAFDAGAADAVQDRFLVHCHMGISRSSAAAMLLLARRHPDRAEGQILAEIVAVRRKAWPNLRMVELGDALLERHGRLVGAVRDHYRDVIRRDPKMIEVVMGLGRGREIDGL